MGQHSIITLNATIYLTQLYIILMAHMKIIISAACLVAELAVAALYEPPKTDKTESNAHSALPAEKVISLLDSISQTLNHTDAQRASNKLPCR